MINKMNILNENKDVPTHCFGKRTKNIPKLDEVEKHKRKQIYSKALGEYGEAIYETIHEQSLKIQNKT